MPKRSRSRPILYSGMVWRRKVGRRSHAAHPRIGASTPDAATLSSTRLPTAARRRYYDVHRLSNMRHKLTILAYEMNGAPVSVLHGAHYGCAAKMSSGLRW